MSTIVSTRSLRPVANWSWTKSSPDIVARGRFGALATLAAEFYADSNYQVFLYTFGAPRVGGVPHTRYLKAKLRGRIFRYYYTGDPITWFPMFPYVHLPGTRLVASSKWIGGHNDYWRSHNQTIARDSDNEEAGMLEKAYQWMRSSGTEPFVYRSLTIGLHKTCRPSVLLSARFSSPAQRWSIRSSRPSPTCCNGRRKRPAPCWPAPSTRWARS